MAKISQRINPNAHERWAREDLDRDIKYISIQERNLVSVIADARIKETVEELASHEVSTYEILVREYNSDDKSSPTGDSLKVHLFRNWEKPSPEYLKCPGDWCFIYRQQTETKTAE